MSHKDDLEQYERTEAEPIVRLLRQMAPPDVERAPPDFRVKVLVRIEAEKRARRKRFSWTFGYQAPVALVAGVLLGIAVVPLLQTPPLDGPPIDDPIVFRGPDGTPAPPPTHASPEAWLEAIAELLVTGQVDRAHAELAAFRQKYPHYDRGVEGQ